MLGPLFCQTLRSREAILAQQQFNQETRQHFTSTIQPLPMPILSKKRFPNSAHTVACFTASLGVLFTLPSQAVHAAETLRYVINASSGTQIGEQVVQRGDDGVSKVRFIMKDNGRGPELNESYRYAADGSLLQFDVSGNSTMGAVVDEHFSRTGNQASWRSSSEKGQTGVNGTALYLPLNSSFEMVSQAIQLFAGKDGSIALLPSGTLTQKVLDQVELSIAGKTQTVQLVAHSGSDLSPNFYWATSAAHGSKPRLFAVLHSGWMSMVEEGWQQHIAALQERQTKAEKKMLEAMAARLQQPLQGLLVVRNARVFDSEKALLSKPQDVYVLRGKISAVLPAGTPVRGAQQEIDAAGRVMLPGLFDMHGHVGRWEGGLNLANGVTTVRDMGSDNGQMQVILDEIASGSLLGPQVVPTGFLEGKSPFSSNLGFVIKDLAEAKNAVDWYAQRGYPQLKIYNSFPPNILTETVAYAHSRGLRVSGHVPKGLRAEQAFAAGYDELQHINQLMLNFFVTPETETRNLNRFVLPAEKVADLDFSAPKVKKLIAQMRKKNIVLDPTLSTFAFIAHKNGEVEMPAVAFAQHMPTNVKRGFYAASMKIDSDAQYQRYQKSYDKMVAFVGVLHKAGVPLVIGTDNIAGFTLHSELEMFVKAGLSPAQALQIVTKNGARYTGTSHERGSITKGKLADLVLVDGEPTQNIADSRKVALVITQGKVIYPNQVLQELGIKPFVQTTPVLRNIAAPLSSAVESRPSGSHSQHVGHRH